MRKWGTKTPFIPPLDLLHNLETPTFYPLPCHRFAFLPQNLFEYKAFSYIAVLPPFSESNFKFWCLVDIVTIKAIWIQLQYVLCKYYQLLFKDQLWDPHDHHTPSIVTLIDTKGNKGFSSLFASQHRGWT